MVCTVIQMVRKSGLGKSVVDEAIGTGNGTNKDFATAYKRVVPGSERLYVASALQTVTDYSMNYTRGDIAMVVAPGDSVLVTGDYLYLARLTEQDLDEALLNAQNFVEGVIWGMDYQWEQFVDLRDITSITLAVGAISDVIMIKIDSEELLEASRSNLPQNPQLDRGDESTDTIVDWSNTGSTATFTWATAQSKVGRRSCQITKTGASDAYWYSDKFLVSQEEPYRLTAWLMTTSTTAGTGNGAYIRIRWFDGSDTLIATDVSSYTTGSEAWAQLTVDAFAPWNAVSAQAEFVHDGNAGDAFFDDVFFSKRNWYEDTTNGVITFTNKHSAGIVNVLYQRTTDNPVATLLCETVGALGLLEMDTNRGGGATKYKVLNFSIDKGSKGQSSESVVEELNTARDLYIEMLQEPDGGIKRVDMPGESDIGPRDLEGM